MSGTTRNYPTPMEQHPSEPLPDEVIPNDAPMISSPEERQRAIQDARIRGSPVDSLPWPNAHRSSQPAPVEQSPAESLPDEMIPNDAPPFPGSSTEGGNVSNGLSTWPSSTQTSSADVSAASTGGLGTERPRLAPLSTAQGYDSSQGDLMRSPNSAAATEMPPPPYTRGQSSQAQTAIAADVPSASSGEFSPPQHNYPGLPPGVSPVSGGSTPGSGSQDALIHGATMGASSRALSGSEPNEAVALPKYSHRPQDGNTRVVEQADGSYKMFPSENPNTIIAMNNIGGSETTTSASDPEAQAGTNRALPQQVDGETAVEEKETNNPARRFWRRHFKGPHNKRKRAVLISLIIFVVVLLIIVLAAMGSKGKLAGQGDGDDDDSDSDDDDDDEDDD